MDEPAATPTRRWSERVSEASRILPKHRGASVSAAWRPGELLIDSEEDRTLRAVLVGAEGAGLRIFSSTAVASV
jgi:hypothetical protein